nr:hypothetical protein [Bartonella sp. ML71XJBT]
MHFHKCKDGGAQWLYRYTLHGRREMSFCTLRKVSFKKPLNMQTNSALF